MLKAIFQSSIIGIFILLLGCGSTTKLHKKKENNSCWQKIESAAIDAIQNPNVWVPLVSTAVTQIGDVNKNISSTGWEDTPVFGSQKNARNFSNYFLYASVATYVTITLFTQGSNDSVFWSDFKKQNILTGVLSFPSTISLTELLKETVHRQRPDNSDYLSFPSGHTSTVAVSNILTQKNIRHLMHSNDLFNFLQYIPTGLTLATAWARIEAKRHYLSDTFAGMALGNFWGLFFSKLLNTEEKNLSFQVNKSYEYNTFLINLCYQFD
ncbi:phosphatase PAP2 family protein [Calditrichota bacterium]